MGSPAGDLPVTGLTQDVRFAVTMSGGVSLAVWMGGIAREVNLLQQASNARVNAAPGASGASAGDWDGRCRELYRKLLQLLDVRVTVDVLSGTSAGGINAALLGLSSAAGVDLARLRDLWLTTGSMDALLRDPGEKNPPSLMQGDKVLFTGLDRGISDLYDNGRHDAALRPPDRAPDTTVFITTTMMSGETSRFTDDYGTLVPDVDNHGLFTFGQQALAPEDGKPALNALALAARSSASFPGAFEPSFVPIHAKIGAAGGIPARPDMAGFANMTRSHWAADGGLLANRPLTPLLDQVFAQPARGQVRRVLAFVVPDGGGTSRPAAQPEPDTWGRPPTMAGAIKEDLGAQLSQSVASGLQAVRSHNDRLQGRHQLRRYLADMGSLLPAGRGLVTGRLLGDYEQQQGAGLAQPVLDQLMRELSTMPLPASWVSELAEEAEPPGQRLAAEMASILGAGWRPAAPPGGGAAAALASWEAAAGPFDRAAAFGLPVFHAARATAVHLVHLGYQGATEPGQRAALAACRAQLEAAYPAPAGAGDQRPGLASQLAGAAGRRPVPALLAVARQLADTERQRLLIGPAGPAARSGRPG